MLEMVLFNELFLYEIESRILTNEDTVVNDFTVKDCWQLLPWQQTPIYLVIEQIRENLFPYWHQTLLIFIIEYLLYLLLPETTNSKWKYKKGANNPQMLLAIFIQEEMFSACILHRIIIHLFI
jgi:hypothetical protein